MDTQTNINDMLRPLSPEELAKVPELTFEQITAALEEGRKMREAAERFSHAPIHSGLMFR